MATARHLETQGVSTVTYLPDLPHYPPTLASELKLFKMTGGKWTTNPKGQSALLILVIFKFLLYHRVLSIVLRSAGCPRGPDHHIPGRPRDVGSGALPAVDEERPEVGQVC